MSAAPHEQGHEATLEAATIVRVAPTGFDAPIRLGAVRWEGRLVSARLTGEGEDLPTPGTTVTLCGSPEDGCTAVVP